MYHVKEQKDAKLRGHETRGSFRSDIFVIRQTTFVISFSEERQTPFD